MLGVQISISSGSKITCIQQIYKEPVANFSSAIKCSNVTTEVGPGGPMSLRYFHKT